MVRDHVFSLEPIAEPWPERPAAKRHERENRGSAYEARPRPFPRTTCGAVARAARAGEIALLIRCAVAREPQQSTGSSYQ